jgi:hypothetical protein
MSRTAADSTMLRTVKRLMALSLATQREQLEQRRNATWPRPFLLRPPFLLFLVMLGESRWIRVSKSWTGPGLAVESRLLLGWASSRCVASTNEKECRWRGKGSLASASRRLPEKRLTCGSRSRESFAT